MQLFSLLSMSFVTTMVMTVRIGKDNVAALTARSRKAMRVQMSQRGVGLLVHDVSAKGSDVGIWMIAYSATSVWYLRCMLELELG